MVGGRDRSLVRRVVGAFLMAVSVSVATPLAAQEPADLIFTNAVIHTANPEAPAAEAMAVSESAIGSIIVAIGSAEEVESYRGPETNVIDLQGRAVIPGLIDAHAHVMNLGKLLRTVDLVGTSGVEEIAARVLEAAAGRPAGEWILGRGWDQNDWEVKEFPTAAALDSAAPDHPVWLTRVDGHAGWANTRALEAAGVTAATGDPEGGRIVRDEAGDPTGIFIDDAEDLVDAAIPVPGPEELAARLAAAQERMVSVGLTGVHDMGTDREEWDLYRAWAAEGRLLPRIVVYLDGDDPALMESANDSRVKSGESVRVRGVKFYADGALGSRGAALLEPYSDDPGNIGLLLTPPDTLRALIERALGLGLQPAIHAIGDRGNQVALDAIEAAEEALAAGALAGGVGSTTAGAASGIAPRIEHAQVVALEDISRFADLGVIASMQPTHATSDMYWAEDRVGP
ncbi:MAG: amidohydrolase, partial [Gemmatimonadota bacterium]